jgi:hypothetical protein
VAGHHTEKKQLPSVHFCLEEARILLDIMAKGVRRRELNITVYRRDGSVQAEDPSDLAEDTMIPDSVDDFELQAKGGNPYLERVAVICRERGPITVEVEGNSEEWVLGKLRIVTRFLENRPRNPNFWFRSGLKCWLIVCAFLVVEWFNYALFGPESNYDIESILFAIGRNSKWFVIVLLSLWVGKSYTDRSLLQVRDVSFFRQDWLRSIIIPIGCSIVATYLYTLITNLSGR